MTRVQMQRTAHTARHSRPLRRQSNAQKSPRCPRFLDNMTDKHLSNEEVRNRPISSSRGFPSVLIRRHSSSSRASRSCSIRGATKTMAPST